MSQEQDREVELGVGKSHSLSSLWAIYQSWQIAYSPVSRRARTAVSVMADTSHCDFPCVPIEAPA